MKTSLSLFGFWALTISVAAQGTLIVVPGDRATQSGNAFVLEAFRSPGTVVTVYGSRNFSGPVQINEIAFRNDETTSGQSFDTVVPRVTIRMSTYSGTYDSFFIGGGYEGNKGSDDSTVFDAAVHWVTTDLPGSGPNPFDLKIVFSKPFIYDPANGGLLMGFTTSGPFTSGIHPDAQGHGDSSIGWVGDKSLDNLVTQFNVTSIPELSPYCLFFAGGVVIFASKRRLLKL